MSVNTEMKSKVGSSAPWSRAQGMFAIASKAVKLGITLTQHSWRSMILILP